MHTPESAGSENPARAERWLLVTGGSRGIGAATALRAAADGWHVVVHHRVQPQAAEAVAQAVRSRGRQARVLQADVADEAQMLALFQDIDSLPGRLAGVVHSAAIVDRQARLDEMSVARWRRMLEVNVLGSLLVAREAVRRMSRNHGRQGGSLVLLSSAAARLGSPAMYVDYAASKGAVDTLALGLAREVAAEGVRVNAVRPGIILTDIHADSGDADRPAKVATSLPMQRPGRAEEVAEAIVWLLSDAASYTTGAILDVTGGR